MNLVEEPQFNIPSGQRLVIATPPISRCETIGDPVPGIDIKIGHNPGGQVVMQSTSPFIVYPITGNPK